MKCTVLWCVILLPLIVTDQASSTCSGYDRSCHIVLDYPDHFVIEEDGSILVGIKNALVRLSMELVELLRVDTTDDAMNATCQEKTFTSDKESACHNYHRAIVRPRSTELITAAELNLTVPANETFIICGTNYHTPDCQYRLATNLSVVKSLSSGAFCPPLASVGIAFVEYDSVLVVGTVPDRTSGAMSQSLQPFNGRVNHATSITGSHWLQASNFVDLYERGEYVYGFFREIASETGSTEVRSRVARICKNDGGLMVSGQNLFQTYLKASFRCGVMDGEDAEPSYKRIPFYYDSLFDTELVPTGSYDQSSNDHPHLYGVFQSLGNGPIGSSVCVYSLDQSTNDVTRVFDGAYRNLVDGSRIANVDPFDCSTSRTRDEALNNLLMLEPVEQSNSPSSIFYTKQGYKFYKVVVGIVTAINGMSYEVMFIAAADMSGQLYVIKVSYVQARSPAQTVEHSMIQLEPSDTRVNHMTYYSPGGGKDAVFLTTEYRIYQMNPYNCSVYLTCEACIAAMDPYCAYNTMLEECVGYSTGQEISFLLQNVTHGVAQCPDATNPTPTRTYMSPSITLLPTIVNAPEFITDESSNDMWEWLGIGAGIGIAIGFVIGIIFMIMRRNRMFRVGGCGESDGDSLDSSEKSGASGYDKTDSNEKCGSADYYRSANGIDNNRHVGNFKSNVNGACSPTCSGDKNNSNEQLLNHSPSGKNLHERRSSHPITALKMQHSPQRLRAASIVPLATSEPVANRDLERYGSNYSLDPESSKPTLTPRYDHSIKQHVDLVNSPVYYSTDC